MANGNLGTTALAHRGACGEYGPVGVSCRLSGIYETGWHSACKKQRSLFSSAETTPRALIWGFLIMPRSPTSVIAPTPETLRDLIDLRGEGPKVLGIAGEGLDGQGLSLAIAEQADDDLAFPTFAVAVIAEGPERIILAFKITAGDDEPLAEITTADGAISCAVTRCGLRKSPPHARINIVPWATPWRSPINTSPRDPSSRQGDPRLREAHPPCPTAADRLLDHPHPGATHP
jgi:hypothetical protein